MPATKYLPRSDVGADGAGGALSVLLLLATGGHEFDLQAVSAAIATLVTFAFGYLPTEYKPFWTAVGTPVATLIATLIGVYVFDQPVEQSAVTAAISSIVVTLFTYVVPPYRASPLDPGAGKAP
jgi:hypothetical protein